MSQMSMNHEVAAWLAGLARAIEAHGDGQTGHGSYYVAEVHIGYDGEDSGYRVLPNEFGGYDIATRAPNPHQPPTDAARADVGAERQETQA